MKKYSDGCLLKKNELFPLWDDVINKIKDSPPCIKVKARAFHTESTLQFSTRKEITKTYYGNVNPLDINYSELNNEGSELNIKYITECTKVDTKKVTTLYETRELKYNYWRDDTNFNSKYYAFVYLFKFDVKINFDTDTEKDFKILKLEMEEKAKKEVGYHYVKEEFSIQGFQKEIKCRKESSCLLDSVFFCIAFIFSFIGYSFIINMFITVERNIKIKKSVFKHYNSCNSTKDSISNSFDETGTKSKKGEKYEPLIPLENEFINCIKFIFVW